MTITSVLNLVRPNVAALTLPFVVASELRCSIFRHLALVNNNKCQARSLMILYLSETLRQTKVSDWLENLSPSI